MDYATQFLKLAGKCFAVIAGLAFIGALVLTCTSALCPLALILGYPLCVAAMVVFACFYAAIPIFIFTAFIIACRAFGRK